jgi:hypothetical protein
MSRAYILADSLWFTDAFLYLVAWFVAWIPSGEDTSRGEEEWGGGAVEGFHVLGAFLHKPGFAAPSESWKAGAGAELLREG